MVNLTAIIRTGYCDRWHSNWRMVRSETLGQHHAAVGQIIACLHPDPSRALMLAALTHDTGEAGLGDVSGQAKRDNPDLAEVMDEIEAINRAALGIPALELSDKEARWLRMADRLSAIIHVASVNPDELEADGWADVIVETMLDADWLGCGVEVRNALKGI